MTLHEAIEKVLRDNRHAMSSSDIAEAINATHLYERGDKKAVPASQISARVNNYPLLFKREEKYITLRNW